MPAFYLCAASLLPEEQQAGKNRIGFIVFGSRWRFVFLDTM
jgi:hypothetical protein